jgi:hypothetical protein
MFKLRARAPSPPPIDLATVRETIAYMQSDIRRAPGLERVSHALDLAVREIDALEGNRMPVKGPEIAAARFLPWSAGD